MEAAALVSMIQANLKVNVNASFHSFGSEIRTLSLSALFMNFFSKYHT